MRFFPVSLIAILSCSGVAAQRLNHFDILLFSTNRTADSTWHLSTPRFLTAYNPGGYNNQPSFFSGSELYVTAQSPTDTTQTDIYALDLSGRNCTRVTATSTAEYSPQLMPGGKRFSAVRVEADGVQRLWSFPLDRSDNGHPEFPSVKGVGYYCWLQDTLAALFIVGENGNPHILYTCGTQSQSLHRIASNIGRSLIPVSKTKLAFVQKATEQTWFLKIWDLKKVAGEILVRMPVATEDFTMTPDGTFLAGKDAKLFQYKPRINSDWKEIADLSKYGVHKITRLASGKDGKLAIVVE